MSSTDKAPSLYYKSFPFKLVELLTLDFRVALL
jgi:hypothetical protein